MYLKSLLSVIVVFVLFSINGYSSSNNNAGLDPPILSYDSHVIDDDTNGSSNGDSDNHCEAGESVEMPVATLNSGVEAATNTAHEITALVLVAASTPLLRVATGISTLSPASQ
jgi:hypothetical protein